MTRLTLTAAQRRENPPDYDTRFRCFNRSRKGNLLIKIGTRAADAPHIDHRGGGGCEANSG